MSGLVPCAQCRRHVKSAEARCVFCGADATSSATPLRTVAILSAAALTLAACSDPKPPVQPDPGASSAVPAASSAAPAPAPVTSATPAPSASAVASAAPSAAPTATATTKPTPTTTPSPTRVNAPRYGMAPPRKGDTGS